MSEPFLGEIKMISWNYAPRGWAFCNGQFLPINQNQALFSLFGTMYGGDGRVNFALPDLRGRTPFHVGAGFTQGERAGETAHTLTVSEMPAHVHAANSNNGTGNVVTPLNNIWATSTQNPYTNASPDSAMSPDSILNTGGSQAHNNLQPYLVINFIVALQGIFPSRN